MTPLDASCSLLRLNRCHTQTLDTYAHPWTLDKRNACMHPAYLYLAASGSSSSSPLLVGFLKGFGLGLYSPLDFLCLLPAEPEPDTLRPPSVELPDLSARGVSSSFLKSALELKGVSEPAMVLLGSAPMQCTCCTERTASC